MTYFISPYPNFIGINPVSVMRMTWESKGGGEGGGSKKIRFISEQEGELKEGEDGTEKEGKEEGEGEGVGEERERG